MPIFSSFAPYMGPYSNKKIPYKVKMTVTKLSFSEKVFLSYGVIAKNYKCIGGYNMHYSRPPIIVYSNNSQI